MKDAMKLCKKWNCILQNRGLYSLKGLAGKVRVLPFLLPSLMGVGIFFLVPFGNVFLTSLSRGIKNYQILLENKAFHLAVKNTCRFVGIGLPLLLLLSFLFALGIYNSRWMQLLKSLYLLPMAVPTAVVVLIWKVFFDKTGILNQLLAVCKIAPVDWLSSDGAFWVLIISYLWKNLGYTIVLWIAGMAGISESMKEAARVDGTTERQCVYYVVLPQLKPTFYTITMLSFLNSFKVFREAYLVAGAYPQKSMYLLQHLFNNWFTNLEIDKMSAAAVVLALFFTLCSVVLQKMWEVDE